MSRSCTNMDETAVFSAKSMTLVLNSFSIEFVETFRWNWSSAKGFSDNCLAAID